MATNHYFNNFSAPIINEQLLLEDLIVECIQIYGHDVYYLPRETYDAADSIYGEDVLSKFTKSYQVEMYLANVEGFEGDGDFFSKFGLEIRDTSNFVVSRRSFEKFIPGTIASRPREGDLLFIPVLNKVFEIKFVEEELLFFSLGKRNPYMYELRCELFRYSNENIETGVDVLDNIEELASYTIEVALGVGSGNYLIGETVYQGNSVSTSTFTARVTDWNLSAKTLKLINTKGSLIASTNMIGQSSNTRYNTLSTDNLDTFVDNDVYDNRIIQTNANTFIDISETHVFGTP